MAIAPTPPRGQAGPGRTRKAAFCAIIELCTGRSSIRPKYFCCLLLLCTLPSGAALAGQPTGSAQRAPSPPPGIVNGEVTFGFPTVGALLYGDQASRWLLCSGTMIGCNTFLTAAHCLCPTVGWQCQAGQIFEPDPSAFSVYLQHGGVLAVSGIALLPTYAFPDDDVAIVKLAQDSFGISPAENSTTEPLIGALGTIVGFGRTGGSPASNVDYGLKRFGTTALEPCTGGIDPQKSICWNYTGGAEANTCNGDSGGPMFIDYGSGDVVAGVTSGGDSATCLELDFSYDANVFNYAAFISAAGGPDILNTVCGTLPPVGDARTSVFAAAGRITDGGVPYTISVPAGTERLVFTMNGVDDGVEDFDLYVKGGSEPTTSDYDCASLYAGQFESCVFDHPAPGQWWALVYPSAGYGDFQITATAFGAKLCVDSPDCDDANPCTEEACNGGFCAYSPSSAPCDDGLFCNGTDTCAAGACSLHGGNPCGTAVCVEPYATCMASCPGSCASELADSKRAKAIEKYVKKRARAISACARTNDLTCPAACPVPDGSSLDLSAGCRQMLACRVDEIAGIFYGDPYGDTWDSLGLCARAAATKCGNARARQGYKLIRKALRRERTGRLWRIATDTANCRLRIDNAGECDGARVCFAASSWATVILEQ